LKKNSFYENEGVANLFLLVGGKLLNSPLVWTDGRALRSAGLSKKRKTLFFSLKYHLYNNHEIVGRLLLTQAQYLFL